LVVQNFWGDVARPIKLVQAKINSPWRVFLPDGSEVTTAECEAEPLIAEAVLTSLEGALVNGGPNVAALVTALANIKKRWQVRVSKDAAAVYAAFLASPAKDRAAAKPPLHRGPPASAAAAAAPAAAVKAAAAPTATVAAAAAPEAAGTTATGGSNASAAAGGGAAPATATRPTTPPRLAGTGAAMPATPVGLKLDAITKQYIRIDRDLKDGGVPLRHRIFRHTDNQVYRDVIWRDKAMSKLSSSTEGYKILEEMHKFLPRATACKCDGVLSMAILEVTRYARNVDPTWTEEDHFATTGTKRA
jgi:hypothetical protein